MFFMEHGIGNYSQQDSVMYGNQISCCLSSVVDELGSHRTSLKLYPSKSIYSSSQNNNNPLLYGYLLYASLSEKKDNQITSPMSKALLGSLVQMLTGREGITKVV